MAQRILPRLVETDRLDAGFYKPEYTKNHHMLTTWGTPKRLADAARRIACGPFGSDLPSSLYRKEGVPLYRVQNVLEGELSASGLVFLDRQTGDRLQGCRFGAADLLLAKSGILGRVANVPSDVATCNVTQDVIGVSVDRAKADPHYLCSFLSSAIGRPQIERWGQGNVQQHLNMLSVRRFIWLDIAPEAQRYIGDKVRQAEQLRERARRLEAAVTTTHAQYIVPPTGIDFAKRTRRLGARSLTERLDAHFYPSAVEQYFRQLGGPTRSLDRLCSLVANGQSQPEAEEGVRQATVTNLGRSFVEGSLRIVERPADGSRALAPHDLLLCNAAHNKSYIGRDVTYSQVEGAYPSTEVMVVRVDRTQSPASFVRHYLKTEIGYLQIQSTIRGITAHSYPTDVKLLEIPMPAVPDVDREAWFATDDQMLAAGSCFDAAKVLTCVATTLVERLIDGRLTEADLVAAQKALEAGDRSADREILRAHRQSDAPDAKPLVADVDALYALLDGSEGQDA